MMRNLWKWILGVLAVALVTFLFSVLFFSGIGRGGFGYGGYGMMVRGMPMMWGWGMFGGLMMLGMLLIPVGVVALPVADGVALVRGTNTPKAAALSNSPCSNCGRPTQSDWTTCPYCGKALG